MKIVINNFVKRQTPESRFSHFLGTWEGLLELTYQNLDKVKTGYRSDVLLVPVPAELFMTSVLNIEEALSNGWIEKLEAKFEARREGEKPVTQIFAYGEKQVAKSAFLVLYSKEALAEDGDNTDLTADYEVICISASSSEEEVPMDVITQSRNVLQEEGGTDVKLEEKNIEELLEFIDNTAKSAMFWTRHVTVQPKN